MNKIKSMLVAAALIAGGLPSLAQQTKADSTGGVSPHETTSAIISGDRVTITYGRPYTIKPGTTEVRKIWGGLVPYGRPWRMGSDEATTLITQKAIEMGGQTIPAGVYTLYMIPNESGASQLVFSSALGGWGIPVNTSHDFAKVDVTKTALDHDVNQFTIAVDRGPGGGGILKWSWEKTQFSAPFTVKN